MLTAPLFNSYPLDVTEIEIATPEQKINRDYDVEGVNQLKTQRVLTEALGETAVISNVRNIEDSSRVCRGIC